MISQGGVMFDATSGFQPALEGRVLQGFVENSNVDAIAQVGRMIEVQRAYELGQSFMEQEDSRIRKVIESIRR